jgi:P pilus assembly chaperone PapD
MKGKKFFMGILSVILVFGLTLFAGCPADDGGSGPTKYTVTFNVNGGTITAGQATQDVEEGKVANIPAISPPAGKEIDGWDTSVPSIASPASAITANVTFTAKWKDAGAAPGVANGSLFVFNDSNVTIELTGTKAGAGTPAQALNRKAVQPFSSITVSLETGSYKIVVGGQNINVEKDGVIISENTPEYVYSAANGFRDALATLPAGEPACALTIKNDSNLTIIKIKIVNGNDSTTKYKPIAAQSQSDPWQKLQVGKAYKITLTTLNVGGADTTDLAEKTITVLSAAGGTIVYNGASISCTDGSVDVQ